MKGGCGEERGQCVVKSLSKCDYFLFFVQVESVVRVREKHVTEGVISLSACVVVENTKQFR